MPRVGVLALQGDFERHISALREIGEEAVEVRSPEALAGVGRLVIPGGESTTVGLLLGRTGLDAAIRERAGSGMPVWGTCMGMILLASEVEGRTQPTLGLLDMAVRRNAFGPQVYSFEADVECEEVGKVLGVFIRAPAAVRLGPGVSAWARYGDHLVGVRSGSILATAFHPELTDDRRVHRWFAGLGG